MRRELRRQVVEQLAVQQDLRPFFRLINPRDHFNNGAFAATVLSCQTVNFAFFQRQIHIIQRQHARELLADILKSDKCGGVCHGQYPCERPHGRRVLSLLIAPIRRSALGFPGGGWSLRNRVIARCLW